MVKTTHSRLVAAIVVVVTVAASLLVSHAQQAPRIAPDVYERLHWRNIGPEGNRFSAAAGVPGDPSTYYVGAASGGVYKTTDGGVRWTEMFDAQPVQSIGALAVSRSDPNVVWAGTGEGKIRSHISIGQGVYKSTDAGRHWTLMGLEQTGRVPRLLIHPHDPDIVLVCALGHAYGPQQERGVFRTSDGGLTWTRTLFVDENTGCSDIAMDPSNPRVLFAGMWQLEIRTWGRESGGPGSGLFTSRDGGVTWKRLTGRGLPTRPVGKVAVAVSQSNPDRVFALIETGDGVPWKGQPTDTGQVWRSNDGGDSWRLVSHDHNAMGRAHYFTRMAVAPDDENEAYFLTALFATTIDGGMTLNTAPISQAPGLDHHDIWIDPTNANRMIIAHDQGLSITTNRGKTWLRQRLKNAQMYHVTVDNEIPYNVLGNKQDEPSYRGPSNSRLMMVFGVEPGIPRAMWHAVGGGESGWATPDPVDSKVIWSSSSGDGMVGGIVVRFDENRRQARTVEVWPSLTFGPAEKLKYRFVWDAPLHISPHDRHTVYVGSQHVHRTRNDGQTWEVISPDLTLNDRSRMGSSGGLTPDNLGVEYAGVVYSIAESPLEKGLIWAGTNDGLVNLTRDGGQSWTNVTQHIPDLPTWGTVSSIVPSRYDAATAYLTVDFHQMNNRDPFVYKTTDYGKRWRSITSGLPKHMLSYAKVIAEDPVRRGLLYLGLENAIFVSFDDGENWMPLQNDLPHAPVSGIVVQRHFNDLVIATYGRGFWIMDDITPLQQLTTHVMASEAHLFPPRPAYRFRPITAPSTPFDDPTVGENPQYGASINYYLKTPRARVTVTIADRNGDVVRTLEAPGHAGLNRLYWNLRHEPTREIRLRTSPMHAPHIVSPPDGRPAPAAGRLAILAPPGTYTVRLSVDGREYSHPLEVRKDPHSEGTEADIDQQMALLFELRRDLEAGVDAVNRVERVRAQLDALARIVDDHAILTAGADLNRTLADLEMHLIDLRLTAGTDLVRYESKLLAKITYLAQQLGNSDYRPTDAQIAVQRLLGDDLRTHLARLDEALEEGVSRFNDLLRSKNVPNVIW